MLNVPVRSEIKLSSLSISLSLSSGFGFSPFSHSVNACVFFCFLSAFFPLSPKNLLIGQVYSGHSRCMHY